MKDGAVTLTGKKGRGYEAEQGKVSFPTQRASYTPTSNINEHSYGRDGGKAACLGSVPSVVVGGSSVAQNPPAMPGTLKIGEDKNVSEIVGY